MSKSDPESWKWGNTPLLKTSAPRMRRRAGRKIVRLLVPKDPGKTPEMWFRKSGLVQVVDEASIFAGDLSPECVHTRCYFDTKGWKNRSTDANEVAQWAATTKVLEASRRRHLKGCPPARIHRVQCVPESGGSQVHIGSMVAALFIFKRKRLMIRKEI